MDGLVGLDVQCQPAVLDRLGLDLGEALEQQVTQPCLDLDGVERREAEVVVEVVAQLQVVELRPGEQQQQSCRLVALAQRSAHRPGPFGIGVACHDGARPSRRWLVAGSILG